MNSNQLINSDPEIMPYALVEIKTEHENKMESNEHSPSINLDEERKLKDFQVHKSIKEETPAENVCHRETHNKNSTDHLEIELQNPCQESSKSKSPIKWTVMRTNEKMWKDRENESAGPINNNRYVLIVNNWPVYWSFLSIKEIIDKEVRRLHLEMSIVNNKPQQTRPWRLAKFNSSLSPLTMKLDYQPYGIIDKLEMAIDHEDCFEGAIRLHFDSLSECERALECLHGKEVDGHTLSADPVEEPVDSKQNADNSVENPDNSMENPDNSVKKRADSVEKSNHSEEDAANESSSDSDSSEPQAKRKRLTEEPWRPDIDVWEKDPAGLYGLKPTFLKSLGISPPIDEWVHVTNFRCDKSELIEVMELAGQVVTCTIVARNQTYAKVRFSHPLEAVQAVSMLNNKSFYGQPLKVLMDQCPSDRVILPKGLESVGPGMGVNGTPLRDIVRHYERYVKGRTSSVNTYIFRNPDERLFSFDIHKADISVGSKETVENQGSADQNRTDCNNSNSNSQTPVRLASSTCSEGLSQSLTTQINPQGSTGKEQASESWSRSENPTTAGPSGNWSIGVSANNHGTMPENSGPWSSNSGPMFSNNGPMHSNSGPMHSNSGPVSINSGPMFSNNGPMYSNSGPVSSNSGPVSTSGPTYGNNTLMPSNCGPMLGNPGTIAGNTGPVLGNSGSVPHYTGSMPSNTGPMPGNAMPYNTGCISNIGSNIEYTGPMATRTRNMSGFAGSVPHTRAMTGNIGLGLGYTGNLSGQYGPQTVNTGTMHGYTGNMLGYTGSMTGNTGPVQGQRNIPGYTGLMSGNSASVHGHTGNMPRCTVTMPNNPGNFNMGPTPSHNSPNFGSTGPMPRPNHGPAGPNFGNTGSTHGFRMPNPSHNMTYTGGPNGPNGSHPGCAPRPNQRETSTDSSRPESSINRPTTESPKQQAAEDYITLEISNLPLSTSFPVLCEKMSESGQVMSLQLTGPGCAIVQFATRSQAERCFQMYNKFRVLDNILDVRFL